MIRLLLALFMSVVAHATDAPWFPSSQGTLTCNAGVNLNTSLLALDSSVNGILLSQGSTTSGQKGNLCQAAVTTSAPAYSTGQTSPLSLKTNGELRVDSATADSLLTTIATNTGTAATDTLVTGTITAVCTDANINACGANSTVSVGGQGIYTVTVALSGTWSATIVFDGEDAAGNWHRLPAVLIGTVVSQITQMTTNQIAAVTGGGYQNIRARANVFTSGTVSVALEAAISQQTVIAVTVPNTWSYKHIAGAATTVVKTGAGVLHAVCSNTPTGTITLYDNTAGSGTLIAALTSISSANCMVYDLGFTVGLTIVTTNSSNDSTTMYQ